MSDQKNKSDTSPTNCLILLLNICEMFMTNEYKVVKKYGRRVTVAPLKEKYWRKIYENVIYMVYMSALLLLG